MRMSVYGPEADIARPLAGRLLCGPKQTHRRRDDVNGDRTEQVTRSTRRRALIIPSGQEVARADCAIASAARRLHLGDRGRPSGRCSCRDRDRSWRSWVRKWTTWDVLLCIARPARLTPSRARARPGHPIKRHMQCTKLRPIRSAHGFGCTWWKTRCRRGTIPRPHALDVRKARDGTACTSVTGSVYALS